MSDLFRYETLWEARYIFAVLIALTRIFTSRRAKHPTIDEYRELLTQAIEAQSRIADELSEIKSRIAVIEKIIREVE